MAKANIDVLSYFDLSDAVRAHQWSRLVNGYWFPLYPACLTLGRALFRFNVHFDVLAAHLVNAMLALGLIASMMWLAGQMRAYIVKRGAREDELIPLSALQLWTAVLSLLWIAREMVAITPDLLLADLLLISLAFLFKAVRGNLWMAYGTSGIFAGLALLTKAFALPAFACMVLFCGLFHLTNWKVLRGLFVSGVCFALVAGPFVLALSHSRQHFSAGESGKLNMAWYVNQADRFEPVAYPSLYHPGQAIAELKHPAKLLARSPEVVYFGSSFAYASIPQWIDPSYWSEGLQPRFVPKQTLKAVGLSLSALRRIATEHLQLLLLFVLLAGAGYRWRSKVLRDPLVMAVLLWALACILAYAIVYLEGRYIFYNVLVIAVLLACCATVGKTQPKQYPLYPVLLLCAALICVFSLQGAYNSSVEESLMGGRPLQGKYSLPEYQAGEALGKIYPKGQEVACMGDDACSSHPMWIHIAGVRLTGYVDGGNGWGKWEADDSCMGIEGNPAAIEALRARKVRAIVAKFERSQPCSAAWKPLGDAGFFFYRPL